MVNLECSGPGFCVHRPPRVQVIVAGFNRCLSKTFESIQNNVVAPLVAQSSSVQVTYVLSRTKKPIVNAWSGESGHSEYTLPRNLLSDSIVLLEQDEVDAESSGLLSWAREHLPLGEEKTMQNLIRYLTVLRAAGQHVSGDAEFIVHLRPDLLYIDTWDRAVFRKSRLGLFCADRPGIRTPGWGYQPNDRFAAMRKASAPNYFGRIEHFREYVENARRFSPEGFLEYIIRGENPRADLPFRASRIRIDGSEHGERFDRKHFFNERTNKVSSFIRGVKRVMANGLRFAKLR